MKQLVLTIVLVILSSFVYLQNLDEVDFQQDEYPVIEASEGFRQTGNFYKWDYRLEESGENTDCVETDKHCNYTRAFPHSIIIAGSAELFSGLDEFSARVPSVIAGVMFIIIYFHFNLFHAKKLGVENENMQLAFGLLSTLFVLFNPIHKDIFGTARMYALLYPLTLLILYLITVTLKFGKPDSNFKFRISDFMPRSISLGALLILGFLLHINTFILGVGIFAFAVLKLVQNESKGQELLLYRFISVSGILGILGLIFLKIINFEPTREITRHFTLRSDPNFEYFFYFVEYPFENSIVLQIILATLLTLAVGASVMPSRYAKKIKDKTGFSPKSDITAFLSSMVLATGVFFTFFADRYPTYFYASFIIPIGYILISLFILWVFRAARSLQLRYISLVFISVTLIFAAGITINYDRRHQAYIVADYEHAYETIMEEINEDEFFIAQFPRKYYLAGQDDLNFFDMGKNREFNLSDLEEILEEHPNGYILWAEEKENNHINREVLEFVKREFSMIDIVDSGIVVYSLE